MSAKKNDAGLGLLIVLASIVMLVGACAFLVFYLKDQMGDFRCFVIAVLSPLIGGLIAATTSYFMHGRKP